MVEMSTQDVKPQNLSVKSKISLTPVVPNMRVRNSQSLKLNLRGHEICNKMGKKTNIFLLHYDFFYCKILDIIFYASKTIQINSLVIVVITHTHMPPVTRGHESTLLCSKGSHAIKAGNQCHGPPDTNKISPYWVFV